MPSRRRNGGGYSGVNSRGSGLLKTRRIKLIAEEKKRNIIFLLIAATLLYVSYKSSMREGE